MKCVCPMGGNRTCPDDCPLAVWADLSEADRKTQRKSVAVKLYKQGFTMERIATQLGVSHQTIGRDLANLSTMDKSKPAKTASNPKGAGRPRGSGKGKGKGKPRGEAAKYAKARDIVRPLIAAGLPLKLAELEKEHGISRDTFERAALTEQGIKDADPEIKVSDLSMTAQQKLAAAIRQHQHKLDAEHATRMRKLDEEVHQRVLNDGKEYLGRLEKMENEAGEKESWYRKLINDHKPPFTVTQYKTILMCLHPDGERTAAKLKEAFVLLENKREMLTGEPKKQMSK